MAKGSFKLYTLDFTLYTLKEMFDLDKWQEIYGTIKKHKLRTLLTAFGVFWGIFMLVLLLGAGKGLENGVLNMFKSLANNTMFIYGGRTRIPYNGLPPGRNINFTNDDYHAIRREIPEVRYLAPSSRLNGSYTVSYGTKNNVFQVTGTLPDYRNIKALEFSYGRFLNENDIREKRKVAAIGTRVLEVLFNNENPIGKYINIKGVFFKVIGVFSPEFSGNSGRDETESVYLPLTTLQQSFNMPDKIGVFILNTKEGADADYTEKKVKLLLAGRHNVDPEDEKAMGGWNSGKEVQKFVGLFFGIKVFIWIVGIGTIIAGIVGVSNIMLIIVKERTKEIGIRKALGAKPSSIISLILTESIVITGVSGYMGLACGVFVLEGIKNALEKFNVQSDFFSNPEVDLNVAISATVVLVVAGALAGLYPARKAAKVNPIEALRAE